MSDNQKDSSDKDVAPVLRAPSQTQPRFQLFNNGGSTASVPIINKATGETDVVFVQHGGRPKLAPGFTVDPVYASRNPALQATKVTN